VLEGEVDYAIGLSGGGPQTVEVVEISAAHLGAEHGDGLSGYFRAGQADDLVAVVEKFGDDGGGDVA
jgi:hypothetical protein